MDSTTLNEFLGSIDRLVREKLIPAEEEVAQKDEVPERILQQMRELGLFGLTLPEEYGGLGISTAEEVEVLFRLCFAAVAFRNKLGTNIGVGSGALVEFGTQAQKARFLPKIAAGEIITSFAVTESESGSDAASLRTKATRSEGGWVISGTKRFISNAPDAQLFTVLARTNDKAGAGGISAFLVERSAKGLSVGVPERKMGQHGSHIAEVMLDDVWVPSEAMLGPEGQGLKLSMRLLDRARLTISAVCVGVAERALDEALRYSVQRRQFGKRIADFQLIQAMLADSRADIAAAKALVREGARRLDANENISMDASCAKMFASEMAGRVVDRTVQIFGGSGYIVGTIAERLFRDARLFRIYEGTTQIQQITIAKHMLRAVA